MSLSIDELIDDIEKDLTITQENLQSKLFDIPKYHAKYLRLFYKYNSLYIKNEAELNKLYRKKYHYYTFEFNKKLENAKELEWHILSDDEYSEMNAKVKKLKHLVDIFDRTLKRINGLSFDAKNIISYLQYLNGV